MEEAHVTHTVLDNDSDHTQSHSDSDESPDSHCNINFVANTPYKLLHGDTDKSWGSAKVVDPAPKPPKSRGALKAGDYLLVMGKDVDLKSTGRNNTATVFAADEELVLTEDWAQFDAEMTGQDLVDLDDECFLLWWQNIRPPAVPKEKAPTIAKKTLPNRGKKKK